MLPVRLLEIKQTKRECFPVEELTGCCALKLRERCRHLIPGEYEEKQPEIGEGAAIAIPAITAEAIVTCDKGVDLPVPG